MLAPRIAIDYSRCTTPFDCKKCLLTCAPAVLRLDTIKVERGKETDRREPGAYRIEPYFRDRCTACMDCVKVCPVAAISVNMPQEVAP
ncbi:MAG: 4Fe-4S dicluster domain-containing protein [Chloroflexota bacterium]|nr:4Fe-4S dicluster domain-containing protein [Chloroflexota bacterium]